MRPRCRTHIRDLPGWTTYGPPRAAGRCARACSSGSRARTPTRPSDRRPASTATSPITRTPCRTSACSRCSTWRPGRDLYRSTPALSRLYSTLWYACVNGREAGTRYRIYALDVDGDQIGASAIYDTGLRQTSRGPLVPGDRQGHPDPGRRTRFLKFDLFAHKRSSYTEGGAFDTITAADQLPGGHPREQCAVRQRRVPGETTASPARPSRPGTPCSATPPSTTPSPGRRSPASPSRAR
jgi:hypothetical protein